MKIGCRQLPYQGAGDTQSCDRPYGVRRKGCWGAGAALGERRQRFGRLPGGHFKALTTGGNAKQQIAVICVLCV